MVGGNHILNIEVIRDSVGPLMNSSGGIVMDVLCCILSVEPAAVED